jgi:radical SAM superfamily enzyme YgiQ (UPF0313 family)
MYQRVLVLNFPKIALEAPPLACALLCEICNKNKVDYDFIDCNAEFYQQLPDSIKDEILSLYSAKLVDQLSDTAESWLNKYFTNLAEKCKDYELIAISVFSSHSISIVNKFLKDHRHKFKSDIVIGGAGIHTQVEIGKKFYQLLKEQQLIDYWVLGEGEIGFDDILNKNFTSTSINNHQFNNLKNFELVPAPNFKKFKLEDYLYNGKRIIGVEGSRGCVRKCTFCNIHSTWGSYKYKDGESLSQELLALKEQYNVDHFWFNDSLINGSLKSFRSFISHLATHRKNNFTWSSQAIIRQKTLQDEDDFRMLKDSGCETLAVGLESFSQSVRFHMGKKFTDADVDSFFNLAQKYNISLFLLMIIGYPTETDQDFEHSLRQLEKYQHLADDSTITGIRVGGTMTISPDMPLYNMRDQLKIEYKEQSFFNNVDWKVGDNTLNKRVQLRVEFEDYARYLGYQCADPEMQVEEILLKYLKIHSS